MRRAQGHAVDAIAFGQITMPDHRSTQRWIGDITVIAVDTLIPLSIDGRRPRRARTVCCIGERHPHDVIRLDNELRKARFGCGALGRRRGKEMGIAAGRRKIEAAHGDVPEPALAYA